jgi:hypothetical protein
MRWWQIRKRNADLDRELQSDIELEEEEQRERGLSPDDAHFAARRAVGNTTLIREQVHEAWGWAALEHLSQDLRHGVRQLRNSPGFTVTAVLILALGIGAVTAVFTLTASVSTTTVRLQSLAASQREDLAVVNIEQVGPDYFATMGITLTRGRDFSWTDRKGATKVAIVTQSMARHYFGDKDPIGQLVSIPGFVGDPSWIRIVGEIRDIKVHDLRESGTVTLFLPLFQLPEGGATFELRTAMDPAYVQTAAADAVKSIEPRLPLYETKTLAAQLDESLVQEQLVGSLSGLFAILALLLTCVGLYGLMAYMVSRRAGEIGIRMALGAQRAQITRMILRQTLLLVIGGLAIGLPGAALASRLIKSELFGLEP